MFIKAQMQFPVFETENLCCEVQRWRLGLRRKPRKKQRAFGCTEEKEADVMEWDGVWTQGEAGRALPSSLHGCGGWREGLQAEQGETWMLRNDVGCANPERCERAQCALRSLGHWSSWNWGAPGCRVSWELSRSLIHEGPCTKHWGILTRWINVEMSPQMLSSKGNAMSQHVLKRDLPTAKKRRAGLGHADRGWSSGVRKEPEKGRQRIVEQGWTSCCGLESFSPLNDPFALGTFSGSTQRSSCRAEKDEVEINSQFSCVIVLGHI